MMVITRIVEEGQLRELRLRGGYILNISGSRGYLHSVSCRTIDWMNPKKRRGIYHASTLREALEWLESEVLKASPCRLCLPSLSYRPRPGSLLEHLRG